MSFDPAARSHIAAVRGALAAIGETFPKPVLDALADHDLIVERGREFAPATEDQIADAVATALLADLDPCDDQNVRHMLASRTLGGQVAAGYGLNLQGPATGLVVTALADTADDILDTLIGPADEAGRDLTAASDMLGDQDDPAAIIRAGVTAVEAWTRAQKARKIIATVDAGWYSLAVLAGMDASQNTPVLRITPASLDLIEKVGRRADAWAVVRAGGVIEFADRETLRGRIDLIDTESQGRVSKQAGDLIEAAGRPYRFK
jgi:hypothetical protein